MLSVAPASAAIGVAVRFVLDARGGIGRPTAAGRIKWIAAVTAENASRVPTAMEPAVSNQLLRGALATGAAGSLAGGAADFASAASREDPETVAGAAGAAVFTGGGIRLALSGVKLGFAAAGGGVADRFAGGPPTNRGLVVACWVAGFCEGVAGFCEA